MSPAPDSAGTERRLVRCARLAMSCWARRWKVIRSDSIEAGEARHCLAEAIRLRDRAREWAAALPQKD